MRRGQLPMAVLEVAVGVVLVMSVLMAFAVGPATPDERTTQLDAYAEDTATILVNEPPRHAGGTRLSEVLRSPAAFDRERGALERRVDRIVPENLMYRVVTPHGSVGFPRPAGVATGVATRDTATGSVTVRMWYV